MNFMYHHQTVFCIVLLLCGTAGAMETTAKIQLTKQQRDELGAQLIDALRACEIEQAMLLLDAGASVDQVDLFSGRTALLIAALYAPSTLEKIINAGADINFVKQDRSDHRSALMEAASCGVDESVRALIKAGADVNQIEERWVCSNFTALHYAIGSGKSTIVSLLIQGGANVYYVDRDGNTALIWAARHVKAMASIGREIEYKRMCELLVEKMLSIPDEAQKKNLYAFLHSLKHAYPRDFSHLRQVFKMPSKAAIWHDNATNPESRPRKEIEKIANQEIKESLLKKYCNQ